jgi:hypothetical protein
VGAPHASRSSGPKAGEDAETKLKTIRRASGYSFPSCDIEQMIKEIEQGYEA